MSRQVLLTVLMSSALLMAPPLAEAGAGEEQRARSRGGSSAGRGGQSPSTSGQRGKAVSRRAPAPRGGGIVSGGSKRQGKRGPSAQPTRRVRGRSSPAAGAPASSPRTRAGSPTRGAGGTTPKSGRITRRTPGGTPRTSGAGVESTVPQRRRGRVVNVQGTQENATKKPGATRVGSSARRATARSTTGRQVSSGTRGRPNQVSNQTTQLNRGQGGSNNVGRKAVPRPPIASSPGYAGHGERRGRNSAYRTDNSYAYRYPYRGGHTRFGRRYTSGYYPHHYYPQRHYRYPGYHRPTAYGSFFYFPGYGFNVGVGLGYPNRFGHYGYSSYAYYPYAGVGYGSTYNYSNLYTGFLRLKVKPRDAQVFVDGYYVGLVDHFDGFAQRLRLEEGTHRIEIRHPQYVPVEFDVLIVPGEKVTFEEYLVPL